MQHHQLQQKTAVVAGAADWPCLVLVHAAGALVAVIVGGADIGFLWFPKPKP